MDIDIHRLRIYLKIQEICRGHALRHQILISLHYRLMQIRASEISAVHEKILVSESLPCRLRPSDKTAYRHNRCLRMYIYDFICDSGSKNILNAEFQRFCRTKHIRIPAVMSKRKTYVRTCERNPDELSDYILELNRV